MNIILLQLGTRTQQTQLITDSAGIWYISFNGYYTGIDSDLAKELTTRLIENVNSVTVVGYGELTHVTSYTNTIDGRATALSSEASFIFDGSTDTLYLRLDEYEPPNVNTIYIGVTIQLSNIAYDDTVNELLYRPDLVNIPELLEQKDPLFYQELAYFDFNQQINNASLQYDEFKDANFFGQIADYYFGDSSDVFADFTKIFTGKIKSYQYSDDIFTIRIKDGRTKLSAPIPPNSLSQTVYSDLRDEFSGTPNPLVYGEVKDHKCIPLDDGAVQTNYTFLIADTSTHSISSGSYTIMMDDEDKTGNVINFSPANGTFQLPAAHYDNNKDVTFSGGGYVTSGITLIDNPLDIVKDILVNYGNIAYTTANYNTTEWGLETAKASDIAIVITDRKEIIEIVSDIAGNTGGGFLLERNGTYTWRTFDSTKFPVLTIEQNKWKQLPVIVSESEEILTSATAKYNQSISSGRWARVTDDSQEDEIQAKINEYRNREFNTYYVSSADALTFAENIMARSNDAALTITGIVPISIIDFDNTKIGELAQIEINRLVNGEYTNWYGKMLCEIIMVNPMIDNDECEFIFKKISDLEEFSYLLDFNGPTEEIIDMNDTGTNAILNMNG